MRKPWSITTTLRNPERLRDFLIVLKNLEGQEWNLETQDKYQILLIQNRIYGYGKKQFYKDLSSNQIKLIDNLNKQISFQHAKEIFEAKNYKDSAMRGRQSINPLKKFGLVTLTNNKIHITDVGHLLLKENYDFGETFFRSFIKWQIPNPDNDDYKVQEGYDIKPFIGTLHLISAVNNKTIAMGGKPKGVSKQEFSLFVPTLVNYQDINNYADQIIKLRKKLNGESKQTQRKIFNDYKIDFAKKFLKTNEKALLDQLLNNLKDYGDNTIRYFRLTRYLYIRGNGFYVDLEPRRQLEIHDLLKSDSGKSIKFDTKNEYIDFISNANQPRLPWETKSKLTKILSELIIEIQNYEKSLNLSKKEIENYTNYNEKKLIDLIENLRKYRKNLQDRENRVNSQSTDLIANYIESLKDIYQVEDRAVALEKYIALGLYALNDAVKIQPNYPVGDDNEPTFTAPAGKPDIECYYSSFNAICEVTMLTGRDQWYNEGQPVMRHLRDFEDQNSDKNSYCLFIAPSLHRDTLNTFWFSIKYEYEGKSQKIVPLSIQNFIELLQTLLELKQEGKFLDHKKLIKLYDEILLATKKTNNVNSWINQIPKIISLWQKKIAYS